VLGQYKEKDKRKRASGATKALHVKKFLSERRKPKIRELVQKYINIHMKE
jgi:hypothetical protein